jgi:hypothetical protein
MKKKKILAIVLATSLALSLGMASAALAWQEGPGTDWWYIDASYGSWKNTVPLVIELDGDSSAGQTFNVGDTINITGELHAVAASCAGGGNGAYTEWHLEVSGPSGPDSDSGWDYNQNNDGCAESDVDTTLSITYTLTATGTHTVYMSSYAAVSQYWEDVADDYVDASLTFEVAVEVEIDIKPGSDPNSINLKSKGLIPVAILTTPDFDASTVDPTTVEFAGAPPVRSTLEDVDGDGDVDMLFHFKTQELEDLDENSTEATLYSYDPLNRLIGTDSVNIVPKGKGNGKK